VIEGGAESITDGNGGDDVDDDVTDEKHLHLKQLQKNLFSKKVFTLLLIFRSKEIPLGVFQSSLFKQLTLDFEFAFSLFKIFFLFKTYIYITM
jgi:hypothetical protein